MNNRKQRVVLNSEKSDWGFIKSGVPQGSILGPLLYIVYINDFISDIQSSIRLFADDTTLYVIVNDRKSAGHVLNSDLEKINIWAKQWLVTFNPTKTESLLITNKKHRNQHPNLYFSRSLIQEMSTHKHLGLNFSNNGQWALHIDDIVRKASSRPHILRTHKYDLNRKSLETLYFSYIRPILEYADVIWDNTTAELAQKVDYTLLFK